MRVSLNTLSFIQFLCFSRDLLRLLNLSRDHIHLRSSDTFAESHVKSERLLRTTGLNPSERRATLLQSR